MKKSAILSTLAAICLAFIGCGPEIETPQDKPDGPDTPSVTDTTSTTDTTDTPEEAPFKLKIYDVSSVMATVEVEPLDRFAPYYMDILSDADFQEATEHGFDDYMAWFLEHMQKQTGESRDEVIKMISSYGNDGFIVTTLTPESKYHAVAVGIDEQGKTTTEVISMEFTTLAKIVSDNVFEVSIEDLTSSSANIKVTASNDDPYILTVEPASTTADLKDEELAAYIIQSNMAWGGIEQMTYKGNTELEHQGKAGWDYEVVIFGYEDGAPTTEITRIKFTMAEGTDTKLCTFEFKQEFDTFEMHLSVTPSDNSVVYVTNVVKKSEVDKLIKGGKTQDEAMNVILENIIEDIADDLGSRASAVELISLMMPETYTLKFEYSTEYIQWAVPVDQEGYPTAAFTCSEPFTTPAEVISPAAITVKEYKVYDGTMLASRYPDRFKGASGFAVVELTIEANSDASSWWSYIAQGDLRKYKKETIIKNLHMAPTEQNLTHQYITAFWGTNTIFGIAQDADGNYGEPLLEVIEVSKDNLSSPNDII